MTHEETVTSPGEQTSAALPGTSVVAALRGRATTTLSTDEILALTRDPAPDLDNA